MFKFWQFISKMDRSFLFKYKFSGHTKWLLIILFPNKPRGDPLSPYIFIICAEFLANKIRKNKNIKRIKVGTSEHKISQYADDTSIFLDGSETSLEESLKELEYFALISGLKVNFDKTQLVWIGSKNLINLL